MNEKESKRNLCVIVREKFYKALEDPIEEKIVSAHCSICPECKAAFDELKETVETLTDAASAIPPSRKFASSVLDSIKKETSRKKIKYLFFFLRGICTATVIFLILMILSSASLKESEYNNMTSEISAKRKEKNAVEKVENKVS